MNPSDIGKAYDQITGLWSAESFDRHNGIDQHKRAIAFATNKGYALDVGCGCTGRFIDLLIDNGFTPEGVDVSRKMMALAKERHPDIVFHHQDICTWSIPAKYDFITAWDSLWHIPLEQQELVLTKLVSSLTENGLFIFSFGGTDKADDHKNNVMGPDMYYSTLGVPRCLSLLSELGCTCRHLEYDSYPELNTYIIVQKNSVKL